MQDIYLSVASTESTYRKEPPPRTVATQILPRKVIVPGGFAGKFASLRLDCFKNKSIA